MYIRSILAVTVAFMFKVPYDIILLKMMLNILAVPTSFILSMLVLVKATYMYKICFSTVS